MTTTTARPAFWDEQLGAHVVTGFAEVSEVLRGDGWSSDPRHNPYTPAELKDQPPTSMLVMDPPDHTRLRRLVAPAFTPRAIASLRPRVASIVDAALDGLGAEADLLAEFGYLIPLAVIVELLDVGAEGAQLFQEETPLLVRALEVDAGPDDFSAAAAAFLEITMFLTPLIAQRREHPGADFISALLAQPQITLDEVLSTAVLLLAAGHETTANLIANSTLALLQHPDQIPHLLTDPARAVEELLRVHGPVKLAARTALVDQAVAGHRIAAGELVLLRLDAANTDPRRFPGAERLDLIREPQPTLAFGAGAHFCLGAALARLEATEALPALFTRHPGMRLRETPHRRESSTFHALRRLPVDLRP